LLSKEMLWVVMVAVVGMEEDSRLVDCIKLQAKESGKVLEEM